MQLLHHFNVFGCNATSIVMFVCFYCYLSFGVTFFFLIYLFVTAKAALPKKRSVFAARRITNNLSPVAKKLLLYFLAFCKISLEGTTNNLACALQCYLCLFCASFALLKHRLFKPKINQKRS